MAPKLDSTIGEVVQSAGLALDRLPETLEEGFIAEAALSFDLSKLTVEEEERCQFDLYGISDLDDDPADAILTLEELELHLEVQHKKEAYNVARYYNPDYVQDPAFRLMFLRGDRYDPELAAKRIVHHFEVKRKLFGNGSILARDVVLSDLTAEDRRAIDSGFIQLLPTRDASGRALLTFAPMLRPAETSNQSCQRILWYMIMTTLRQDENLQKKGTVGLVLNLGPKAQPQPLSLIQQIEYVRTGIPHRIVALHYCYEDPALKPYVTGFQLCLDREARTHFRSHCGNSEQIIYDLTTFGIPTENWPLTSEGSLNLSNHKEWVKAQERSELQAQVDSTQVVVLPPRRFDIIFGRGMSTRRHTGNRRAAHLVAMFEEEYELAEKVEKTKIAERIVDIIHESHGRFLKWDEDEGWTEVSNAAAREKISHFFRHLRSKSFTQPKPKSKQKKKQTKKQTQSSRRSTKRVNPSSPRRVKVVPSQGLTRRRYQ